METAQVGFLPPPRLNYPISTSFAGHRLLFVDSNKMLELSRPHSFPERQDRPRIRKRCEDEEDKLKYSNPSSSPSHDSAASSSHDSAASSSPSHDSAASSSPSHDSAASPSHDSAASSSPSHDSADLPQQHKEALTSPYTHTPSKSLLRYCADRLNFRRSKAENFGRSKKRKLYSRSTPALADPEKEPFAVMMAQTLLRCQNAALEYYNMKNNADYEIAGPLDSRSFMKDVYWLHCNFMAKPRNGDISPKLFFAEVHCPCQKKPGEGGPWTVTACLVVEGKTTDGCNHCHGVVHPIHGFSQGNRKNQRKGHPPIIDCCLPESVKRIRRADIALEYYNKENGTDYEVVYTMDSSGFSSDGDCNSSAKPDSTWYHFNFLAWRNVDGKYNRMFFFAEMFGDVSQGMEYLTVPACLALNGSFMDSSCAACSGGVIHPAHGFLKGIRNTVYKKESHASAVGLGFDRSMSSARNLPSWMSSRGGGGEAQDPTPNPANQFSKLLDGVVFALSGFVNPERAQLRSWALEMGAKFQPDWNPSCTLLVCAFRNTPKFRQVESDSGTIVSKDWISECYNQKKLVDIEPYLMNPGKPWRNKPKPTQDVRAAPAPNSHKQEDKSSNSGPTSSRSSQNQGDLASRATDCFSPSKVKKWATDDLGKTLSWLQSQDEKPEEDEIKKIAAEGILTCLQDAIDTLEQGQPIEEMSEQWSCIPRAVEELVKLESGSGSVSREELRRHAAGCKRMYEAEYSKIGDEKVVKKMKSDTREKGKGKINDNKEDCDSDETVVMTEDEIEKAYSSVSSSISMC